MSLCHPPCVGFIFRPPPPSYLCRIRTKHTMPWLNIHFVFSTLTLPNSENYVCMYMYSNKQRDGKQSALFVLFTVLEHNIFNKCQEGPKSNWISFYCYIPPTHTLLQAGSHFPTDRPTTTADEWKLVQGSDCLNTVTLGFSHIILYCVLESFSRFYCFPSSALLSVYSPPWSPLLCHGRPGRTQGYNYYTCSIICPATILLRLLASSPLSLERGIVPVI